MVIAVFNYVQLFNLKKKVYLFKVPLCLINFLSLWPGTQH